MCPVCLATVSLILAGAISTGGVTALAGRTFYRGRSASEGSARRDEKELCRSEISSEGKEKQS
jgi:hypothetical protein